MKETRCPFLETKTVTFCKAFPSKMIPVDRMSSSEGICNTCDFEECALYSEVGEHGKRQEDGERPRVPPSIGFVRSAVGKDRQPISRVRAGGGPW